jgi:hypothetical protein
MSIACVVREKLRNIPAVAVGLGSDLSLNSAMYKALLEAVGVARLAKLVLMDEVIGEAPRRPADLDPRQLFDLDRNVAFYALARHSERVNAKFVDQPCIAASDLPADADSDLSDQIRMIVDGFRRSGKELLFCNLSSPEVRQLAFTALRVWSPDTLGLALPSAPPAVHPRFAAYGGFQNDAPHPYP